MSLLSRGVHNEWLETWVVFSKTSNRYAWDVFCHPTMGHCWLFWSRYWPEPGPFSRRFTIKAEHTPGGVYQDFTLLDPDDVLAIVKQTRPTDVLSLSVRVQRNRMRYFGLLNCVTVVKAALNIHAPWCLTPSQLHRRLVMMGAKSCMEGR